MLITANYMILTVFPEPFKGWSDMINHRVSVVEEVVDIRSQNDRMNNMAGLTGGLEAGPTWAGRW